MHFIKNQSITPPIIGRISIGGVDEDFVPYCDEEFSITTLCQQPNNSWTRHPINNSVNHANEKLRSIPVRLAYDNPDLNFRASNIVFEPGTGRPLCSGDNAEAIRSEESGGTIKVECPGPDVCQFGLKWGCKTMGRLYLQVEGQDDVLGVFVHRTSGSNTTRYLSSRLSQMAALMKGKLAGFPLSLVLRAKTVWIPDPRKIIFVDLTFREGMSPKECVERQKEFQLQWDECGWDREAFEAAVISGFKNSEFELNSEDGLQIATEFYGHGRPAGVEKPRAAIKQEVKVARPQVGRDGLNALMDKIVSESATRSPDESTEATEGTGEPGEVQAES